MRLIVEKLFLSVKVRSMDISKDQDRDSKSRESRNSGDTSSVDKKYGEKQQESSETLSPLPSQEDLEKEIGDYLSKKYGGKVRIVSQMVFPKHLKPDETGEDGDSRGSDRADVSFDLKPEELEEYLNQYVIRQDEAKAVLATKVCTHFNRIRYLSESGHDCLPVGNIKNNVILMGPTGVGKTFLVKLIADRLGVPFVKGDATKFSETGYVGGDVEDLVRDLVREAGGDVKRAECGIIYIDEIDKIAATRGLHGPDVSRAGVQRALLKPLEETEVELKTPHDPISQLEAIERYRKTGKRDRQTINTKNILFIVSGAFAGLDEIIRKRLTRQSIGFGAEIKNDEEVDWLAHVKPQDLIEYGFESEFIGRIPVIALLHELSEDDLFDILRNPNSNVVISKKHDFRAYGIDLKFEYDALRLLAHRAHQEKTGARALVSVVEKALLPYEKRLPSLDVSFLVVTKEMVQDPERELEKFLENPFNPRLLQSYEALVAHEKDQLAASIMHHDLSQWTEDGVELTSKRQELIAHICLKHDLPVAKAADKVLFWIRQIRSYEVSFFNRCGIRIEFDDSAVDRLLEGCQYDSGSLYSQCERLSNILEYGLTMVKERSGQDVFHISSDAVENPELYINRLIRQSYTSDS